MPLFSTPKLADELLVIRNDELGMVQVGNDLLTNKIFVKKVTGVTGSEPVHGGCPPSPEPELVRIAYEEEL